MSIIRLEITIAINNANVKDGWVPNQIEPPEPIPIPPTIRAETEVITINESNNRTEHNAELW